LFITAKLLRERRRGKVGLMAADKIANPCPRTRLKQSKVEPTSDIVLPTSHTKSNNDLKERDDASSLSDSDVEEDYDGVKCLPVQRDLLTM